VLRLLADTVERLRSTLPSWLGASLPTSTDEMQMQGSAWLRGHSRDLQRWGQDTVRAVAHVLVGLVIGLVAAFERGNAFNSPSTSAARQRGAHLLQAFSEVWSL
jgi:hypothetical protein